MLGVAGGARGARGDDILGDTPAAMVRLVILRVLRVITR